MSIDLVMAASFGLITRPLDFTPQPDGLPNRMFYHDGWPGARPVTLGTGDAAWLVTSPPAVLKIMTDPTSRWASGDQIRVNGNGLRSKLDLLNMDPPRQPELRRIIDPIANAGGDWAALPVLAERLAGGLDFRDGPVDLVESYCEPFVAHAATRDMGVPLSDWKIINGRTTSAGLITNPGTDDQLEGAWRQIYAYCTALVKEKQHRPDDSQASRFVTALGKGTASQDEIVHAIATNFTGYPTPLTVLIVTLFVLITQPELTRAFLGAGSRDRMRILGRILRTRANFAAGKPRELGVPLDLGQGLVLKPGEPLIPSVWAALAGGHGWHLAFGAGDHRCPFFNDSMRWLLVATQTVLEAHPGMRLARRPEFPPGLLAVPPALLASDSPAG